jgi:hypothetical protein
MPIFIGHFRLNFLDERHLTLDEFQEAHLVYGSEFIDDLCFLYSECRMMMNGIGPLTYLVKVLKIARPIPSVAPAKNDG